MDQDQVLALLRRTHGMAIETALRIKADDTLLVLCGPRSEGLVELASLALNADGVEWIEPATLARQISDAYPQSIATARTWRARMAAAEG